MDLGLTDDDLDVAVVEPLEGRSGPIGELGHDDGHRVVLDVAVDEVLVDLVGHHPDAVARRPLADGSDLLLRIHGTSGVRRRHEDEHLGPRRPGRLEALDAPRAIIRYEREKPGELIHIDTKKLGRIDGIGHRITGDRRGQSNSRGVGWEFVHVCIDDNSRVSFVQIMPDERKTSAVAFLEAVVAYYASLGITVERVMTDNGSCYRSHAFAAACEALGAKHRRTRPYRPQTNGKAERFNRTLADEFLYARRFRSESDRRRRLDRWVHDYNCHRHHTAIGGVPASRAHNLTGTDT